MTYPSISMCILGHPIVLMFDSHMFSNSNMRPAPKSQASHLKLNSPLFLKTKLISASSLFLTAVSLQKSHKNNMFSFDMTIQSNSRICHHSTKVTLKIIKPFSSMVSFNMIIRSDSKNRRRFTNVTLKIPRTIFLYSNVQIKHTPNSKPLSHW